MGNKIKKGLAIALALCLFTASFSACGKKEQEPETVTRGGNTIEAPETEATTEETTAAETTTKASSTTTTPTTTKPQPNQKPNGLANAAAGVATLISTMGFDYDTEENVFYTQIDSWQRSAGFIGHYDIMAQFGNMRYKTVKMDFSAPDAAGKDLNWRIQMWKGKYGVFGGAEIGIYTQVPGEATEFYDCADDDHMIYMMYELYLNEEDFSLGRKYFRRGWQKHWWLTGFKPLNGETVNPKTMVMRARIRMHNEYLAMMLDDGFMAAGFMPGDGVNTLDTYKRAGTDIFFVWQSAGQTNY